jgi:hypothetical protein
MNRYSKRALEIISSFSQRVDGPFLSQCGLYLPIAGSRWTTEGTISDPRSLSLTRPGHESDCEKNKRMKNRHWSTRGGAQMGIWAL